MADAAKHCAQIILIAETCHPCNFSQRISRLDQILFDMTDTFFIYQLRKSFPRNTYPYRVR